MKQLLHLLADGQTLTREQAEHTMHLMMQGKAAPLEMAGLLMGLRSRGETLEELVGFTHVMRTYAVHVDCSDPHAIDLCGTGGDASGTFNISTAAAFVCSGAGVTVAKHGNRSVSSKCGSADVLDALGINIGLGKEGVERCLQEVGIAFLFAPHFHPAMRYVMPVRKQLGVRTFFNILGPLCNPAGVRRQLVGAFSPQVARTMAGILAQLEADHVIVVHSEDGLDEVALSAPTQAFHYEASFGQPLPRTTRISPQDHDLQPAPLEALQGGNADDNARIIRALFAGERGPYRDVVLLNAAYALHTSGRFDDLDACFEAARESIDSGAAEAKLQHLAAASNDTPRAA